MLFPLCVCVETVLRYIVILLKSESFVSYSIKLSLSRLFNIPEYEDQDFTSWTPGSCGVALVICWWSNWQVRFSNLVLVFALVRHSITHSLTPQRRHFWFWGNFSELCVSWRLAGLLRVSRVQRHHSAGDEREGDVPSEWEHSIKADKLTWGTLINPMKLCSPMTIWSGTDFNRLLIFIVA